jgi:LPPG:FO 2-phospho-L-lactate transferase
MRAVVLAGGYGGARFARGLRDYLVGPPEHQADVPGFGTGAPEHRTGTQENPDAAPAAELRSPDAIDGELADHDHDVTVIVNTADDIRLHGLHISPDLDTVMYTLGGGLDEMRGWGRSDEAFRVSEELASYSAGASWFGLGDRDLATHLIRTQMREAGYSLTDVTRALCERWRPGVNVLPMTDDRVETHVVVGLDGEQRAIHFQEWWIRHHADLPASGFVQVGGSEATPSHSVRSALETADVVLLAPSNPVVSIGPILSVPGMRELIQASNAPVVGVSPIIAGSPLRGMADRCLATINVPSTAAGVAGLYAAQDGSGILDAWLIDEQDAGLTTKISALGVSCRAVPTIMDDAESALTLARDALASVDRDPGVAL